MRRTQIYLDQAETAVLDNVARETGRTRSDLIRTAIRITYASTPPLASALATLGASAGVRKSRHTGAEAVDRLRRGGLARKLMRTRP